MVSTSSQQASATRPPTVPQFVNELVKVILRSPLHGLLSKNRMLLTFTGRKSGKLYTHYSGTCNLILRSPQTRKNLVHFSLSM